MGQASDGSIATLFAEESVYRLQEEYLPRLRRALAALPPGEAWWKPHPDTTSIGALLRHLRGNLTQWILSGLGGRADARDRASEFAGAPSGDALSLLAELEATVAEACAVIRAQDAASLAAEHGIQGYRVTGLKAVFHVVEHFSWHTGQITWIAKLRAGAGHGLSYYDDARLNAAKNP